MDKRKPCIWAGVELDNSRSDRQGYIGQETALCFLFLPASSLSQAPGPCQVSLTKNIRVSQLGIWRLQFYQSDDSAGIRLPFPLPLLLEAPPPANRCRFLHIKAVDLPESFLHASNALCFRGLYLGPLIKLLNAALHMAHHQRRMAHAGTWKCRREKHLRGIGLCLHTKRQAKREGGGHTETEY